MPQHAQAQQGSVDDLELELDRTRLLKVGYLFGGIPTSAAHAARAKGQNLESQFRYDSQSSPPSRPATTEQSYSQFNRPDVPDRSFSDPAPDSDISGTVSLRNEGEEPYLSPEDDPSQQMIGMYSPKNSKWMSLLATLDTGANGNWITENNLKMLNIEAQPNSARSWEMDSFSGKSIRSQKQVMIQWTGPEARKTYRTIFRVAEAGAPFDVILGKEFLFGEDILTFNKSVLIFVRNARSEAEEKKIAERKAQEAAANQALEEKRLQEKALREWLEKNNKGQGSGLRSGAGSGSGKLRR